MYPWELDAAYKSWQKDKSRILVIGLGRIISVEFWLISLVRTMKAKCGLLILENERRTKSNGE